MRRAARPTLYAGVRMRSRLEASFAQHLEEKGFSWEYEPTCFASRDGQWLPDFKSVGVDIRGERRTCYFEVKPSNTSTDALAEVHYRASVTTHASEPRAVVIVAVGHGWPDIKWKIGLPGSVFGLSDPLALGELTWPSTIVIESRSVLGGRARRFVPPIDPGNGRAVLGGRARRIET